MTEPIKMQFGLECWVVWVQGICNADLYAPTGRGSFRCLVDWK